MVGAGYRRALVDPVRTFRRRSSLAKARLANTRSSQREWRNRTFNPIPSGGLYTNALADGWSSHPTVSQPPFAITAVSSLCSRQVGACAENTYLKGIATRSPRTNTTKITAIGIWLAGNVPATTSGSKTAPIHAKP
jgi:hypothetical protein